MQPTVRDVMVWDKDLMNFCKKLTGNSDDAKDLKQETYFKIIKTIAFHTELPNKNWVLTIARNLFISNCRYTKAKKRQIDLIKISNTSNEGFELLIAEDLNKVLKTLSPKRKAVVDLLLADKTIEEIKQELGLSRNTLSGRIFKLRGELAKKLEYKAYYGQK